MATAFIESLIAQTSTASFPVGALDWVPGGVQRTGADVGAKRLRVGLPGNMSASEEGGIRDAQPNGRVHVTFAVQMSGPDFKAEHLGLGELLFVYSTDTDLPWGLQTSRMVTYSDVNRRIGIEIERFLDSRRGTNLTAAHLYKFATMRARLWKFIGAQPTEHNAMAQKRDFVHMAVAVSHFCNIKNVFLADTVVEAGDLLHLVIDPPNAQASRESVFTGAEAKFYAEDLKNICLRPYVTKFRRQPQPNAYSIYIGVASLMYGTQFDERDPYRYRMQASDAIRCQDRQAQRRVLDAMPTLDVFLLR